MAVPKRKKSTSRRDQRRAHHALKVMHNIGFDIETGGIHLSHCADKNGIYKGKKIIFKRPSSAAEQNQQESVEPQAI